MATLTLNLKLDNFEIISSKEDANMITAYGETTETHVRS